MNLLSPSTMDEVEPVLLFYEDAVGMKLNKESIQTSKSLKKFFFFFLLLILIRCKVDFKVSISKSENDKKVRKKSESLLSK